MMINAHNNSRYAITDNHLHIDPLSGLGPEKIGKLFHRSGGTHAFVVNKMVKDYAINFEGIEDFHKATALFLRSVERMNKETQVQAFAVVGPHPAELVGLWNAQGPERAVSLMEEALSYSGEIIRKGKAVALGEVGRPHFEVDKQVLDASNRLLDLSFRMVADIGCAVQVHMESSTLEQFEELASRARAAGLLVERVVKHFSPPLESVGRKTGIFPSIIASRKNVEEALSQGDRFLMETDYIDDVQRPGAVLGPKTVPKVTRSLLQRGVMTEAQANRIHVGNVEKVYGVEISL